MFREKILVSELPDNTLRITHRPDIRSLLGALVCLALAILIVFWSGEESEGIASLEYGIPLVFLLWLGGSLVFIWIRDRVMVEVSQERGIVRKNPFGTWTVPASAIAWVWAYPQSRDDKFYSMVLRARVELPDDRHRKIRDLWVELIRHEFGEWLEQVPPIVPKLNAALTSSGFGQPADVEQVMQADTDYQWLARTARKHPDPHIQALSLEMIQKRFPQQAGKMLVAALDHKSPLVALMAASWLSRPQVRTECFKEYKDRQGAKQNASETLQRLAESPSAPAFIREPVQWEFQRGERTRRKVRSQMIGYSAVGLLLMAVAIFAFLKAHALIALSDSNRIPYQLLGFFCAFFGTQSFFVGYLYALVLKFRYDDYGSLVSSTAAAFSYVYAILSLIVFYKTSYLAAFICYLLIYPALCYLTYKRF